MKSILTSIEELTELKKLHLQKSCAGCANFKGIVFEASSNLFEVSTLEISGSCSELVTALSYSALHSVRRLLITDDQIEALPDCIAEMQKVECMELKCQSLKALPEWIGHSEKLSWDPKLECWSLQTLPNSIASLGGVRKLSLSGCKNIQHLPDTMRLIESLGHLDLSGTGIIELPPWLGWRQNMTHLNLSNTHQNDVLLSGLSYMTSLEELDLSGSNVESLRSCISNFTRLTVLNVSGCKQLQSLPHLSSSLLCKLDASNCTNLRRLPNFSKLRYLNYLSLRGCDLLECIPGFKTIAKNVETLELPGPSGACSNLRDNFKNKAFKRAFFRNLWRFKMGGNLIVGSHSGQQSLSFLLPDVRLYKKCTSLTLTLAGISSPVNITMIMEDDLVLLETMLSEDDFDNEGSKTFSSKEGDEEILEHLGKGYGTILPSKVALAFWITFNSKFAQI
ncbi:Disease resistance protein [Nymphaea thermarum]|nr:Disease resistance protein [Nymphaea thermarum]